MKNIDDLVDSASDLAQRGLSKGEIADELNVSRETASWLVERSGTGTKPETSDDGGPHDIHVDWSAVGRDSNRLYHTGAAMADLLSKKGDDVDLTIGIEKAGAPLATTVARELETDLGTYAPTKHQWDDDETETTDGSFSRNFAQIRDRDCYVVDDTITSGKTMGETIDAIHEQGGNPVACVVLADKRGVGDIRGVPVYSLLQVIRVGSDGDS
ncbi:orotate phosphoribosyltransferase-like protein [Haloarcula sp. S1AR25-5A]|uniref:Transcriptional regulator GfcR n=1 Tax=Haloarcula terrestris TaxID=2950533 RepID=A0AAE4EZC5_9EURY|nr:transcriptional regulator GfcR [Haloarcula terrestris]MDS0221563.1 orotate phosphoribosyltransferase-like protein [Haloarcula terrestris]